MLLLGLFAGAGTAAALAVPMGEGAQRTPQAAGMGCGMRCAEPASCGGRIRGLASFSCGQKRQGKGAAAHFSTPLSPCGTRKGSAVPWGISRREREWLNMHSQAPQGQAECFSLRQSCWLKCRVGGQRGGVCPMLPQRASSDEIFLLHSCPC